MEALDFGKYNFYIWMSYGLTFIVLVWNIALPLLEEKKLIKALKRRNYLANNGSNEIESENTNESEQ